MIYRLSTIAVALVGLASAQSTTTVASSMASIMSASSADLGSTTISLASSTGGSATVSIPAATATSYPINVGAVPLATRQNWCQAQRNVCTDVCSQMFTVNGNVCDANTLEYTCQCSQITTPDLARYNNTIPYQECITYRNNCVAASTMDLATQEACLAIQCGGIVAAAAGASSSASSTMTTATGTGAAAAASTTAARSGNAAPTQTAQNLGLSLVVAVAALIGLAL